MDTVTVDKARLVETLIQNRDEHRAIFEKAQEVYREQMIAELDRALTEARRGGKIVRAFALPVPEEHTEDFNTAIKMLEWHEGEQVEISTHEFLNYVENNWGWQRSFVANTGSYLAQ